MFLWTTSNVRCNVTHGLGYKQKLKRNCCDFTPCIIKIIVLLALFLPMSETQFHHHKLAEEQVEELKTRLDDYHNFYENIASAPSKLQFRHHKRKRKNEKLVEALNKVNRNYSIETAKRKLKTRLKTTTESTQETEISTTIYTLDVNTDSIPQYKNKQQSFSKISSQDEPVFSVLRGDTVSIPCEPERNLVSPGVVSWQYNDGKPITERRFSVENDGSLLITDAQPSDSNTYVCKLADSESYRSILEVFQPTTPLINVRFQFNNNVTKNRKNKGCTTSELSLVKLHIRNKLFAACDNNKRCIISNLRVSCQYHQNIVLDVALTISGILTTEILQVCKNKLCMENKMKDAVIEALKALKKLLSNLIQQGKEPRSIYPASKYVLIKRTTSCEAGYGLKDDKCMPCRAGYFSNPGASDCVKCYPGTYQPEIAASGCLSCNGYSSEPGSTEQSDCHNKFLTSISSNNLQVIIPLAIISILSFAAVIWTVYFIRSLVVSSNYD